MNIVIYARYSYQGQREESIEGQLKACYEYAKEKKYNVIGEYIDRAKSARTDERPEFQRMISDSNARKFQAVLVYQLDRFARNRYDSAINKNKLRKNGVAVLSAMEHIDDSPEGQMIEGILESFAEYQSADMAQKIRRGLNINAEKCIYNGGVVPLGYVIDDHKHFQIDPDASKIVKKVFQDYNDDVPIVDIVDRLRASGVKTARGTNYTVNSFRTMLQNRRYTGCYIYGDIEIPGGIPRIIEDQPFENVQVKLNRNKRAPGSKIHYLLTTKLFCGECNEIMVGRSGTSHTGQTYSYYSCKGHQEHKCNLKDFPKDKLENIVLGECRKRLTDESINVISKEVSKLTQEDYDTPLVKSIQKEIRACETAIDNLTKAIERGEELDLFVDRIKKKRQELNELENNLAQETADHVLLSDLEIRFFLLKLRDGSINSFKYKQQLINTLVNKVIRYSDHITIYFNTSKDPIIIKPEVLEKVEEIERNKHNGTDNEGTIHNAKGSHVTNGGVPT